MVARRRSDGDIMHRHGTNATASGVCNTYANILGRFWYVICIIVITMMAAYGTIAFTLYKLPDFSDPVKGFDARGTEIAARLRSITNMLYYSGDYLSQSIIVPGRHASLLPDSLRSTPTLNCRRPDPDPTTNNSIWFGASLWDFDELLAKVIFEGVGGRDILSASSLKSMCSTERNLITSHPLHEAHCLCHGVGSCPSTWSLGNYAALMSNKSSCLEITDSDAEHVSTLLRQCAPFFHNRTRSDVLGSNDVSEIPAECAQHDYALHTMLFFLLPVEFSDSILRNQTGVAKVATVYLPLDFYEEEALESIYTDNLERCSCSDGITELKAVDFSLKFSLFESRLLADSVFLVIGVFVIFMLIWIYTGSFIITVAALLNIVFSLLMSYFFFTVVFVRPFFPFSNVLAAVLVIGIGADDAFVFIDLWKKCKSEVGGKDLVALTRETLRHATTTMFVTSFTTATALFASVISDITAVKCFGLFAGTAILVNLVLTLSLTPAFVVLDHKLKAWISRRTPPRHPTGGDDGGQNKDSCRQRLIQHMRNFFEEILPSFVVRLRYLWIVLLLLLGAGGALVIFYKPGIKLPTIAENQFFIISHHFEQYDFVYKDLFAYSNKNKPYVPGYIIFGVEAVDNGNNWDPDALGSFTPRQDFAFSSPTDQEWMLDFCQDLRNQSFVKSDSPYDCFMERFKLLMEQPCVSNPFTGQDASPCCGRSTFPYPSSVFDVCASRFYSAGYIPSARFSQGNASLAVITVPFTMSYKQTLSYAVNDELWTSANTWVESKLASAPAQLQHGWFVPFTTDIAFFDLQKSLASGTLFSLLLTLGIGSVTLLLSIQNLILTINAMVTITSTVFVTVGALVLLGWELNIVESTVITLSVGLSVDFTIHYGVAYRLAPYGDRKRRTLYSLSTMSGAISIAALSTFLAGALVMPATVYGYTQFGIFLMIVMSVSWTYSTFFFQAVCFTIGPQNSACDVPCSSWCDCFGYHTDRAEPEVDPGIRKRPRHDSPLSDGRHSSVHRPRDSHDRRYSETVIGTVSNGRFLPINYPELSPTRPNTFSNGVKRAGSIQNGYDTRRNSQFSLPPNSGRHSLVKSDTPSFDPYPKRPSTRPNTFSNGVKRADSIQNGYDTRRNRQFSLPPNSGRHSLVKSDTPSFDPYPKRPFANNNDIHLNYLEVHYNPVFDVHNVP